MTRPVPPGRFVDASGIEADEGDAAQAADPSGFMRSERLKSLARAVGQGMSIESAMKLWCPDLTPEERASVEAQPPQSPASEG